MGKFSEAQISPASIYLSAYISVTPHYLVLLSMAQSIEEGPLSPLIPGCTMKHLIFL